MNKIENRDPHDRLVYDIEEALERFIESHVDESGNVVQEHFDTMIGRLFTEAYIMAHAVRKTLKKARRKGDDGSEPKSDDQRDRAGDKGSPQDPSGD
jgi:hypothetical protein